MTKSIKIEDEVHKKLEDARFKRETYSQAVARMIKFFRDVEALVIARAADHSGPPAPGDQGVTKP